jgi:hypothetical protein
MENKVTHYWDNIKWIEKVIESCETPIQTFAARRLVRNFEEQLQRKTTIKEYYIEHYYDISHLKSMVENKQDELILKELGLW